MISCEETVIAKDLNQQGVALMEAGNLNVAKEKIEAAIDSDPMLVDSYKNYGRLLILMEEFEKAKNAYKKALLIENNGELHYLYGNACFFNDEVHEGIESYHFALNAGYVSPELLFFMGLAYEHIGDNEMALRYCKKAVLQDSMSSDYRLKVIELLREMGFNEEAYEEVNNLLIMSPELFDGYHIKTFLLLGAERYDEAIEFSKSAVERFPEDVFLTLDYARSLYIGRKFEEALLVIEQAMKMKYFEASKSDFLFLKGQVLGTIGEVEQAINIVKSCIDTSDGSQLESQSQFMLLNLFLSKKDFYSALEYSESLVGNENNPYYFVALYYRALCLKELGKKDEALKRFKEANSVYRLATMNDLSRIEAYFYRAMCLKELENYEKALDILNLLVDLGINKAEIYILKSEIYKLLCNSEAAEKELQKAHDMDPTLKELKEGKVTIYE